MRIELLNNNEIDKFKAVLEIFAIEFDMKEFIVPAEDHLKKLLDREDLLIFIANIDDTIIGGLTIRILSNYYSEKPIAYIYDLAIQKSQQRNGYGGKLMEHALNYCKTQGYENAYVEAESDDIQAVDFYRSTPFDSELQATHFTYNLENN